MEEDFLVEKDECHYGFLVVVLDIGERGKHSGGENAQPIPHEKG